MFKFVAVKILLQRRERVTHSLHFRCVCGRFQSNLIKKLYDKWMYLLIYLLEQRKETAGLLISTWYNDFQIQWALIIKTMPVLVAARSKSWVCGSSLTGIVCSNPAGDMTFVCCDSCVLSGWDLREELITRPEKSYWLRCCLASRNLSMRSHGRRWAAAPQEKKYN